MTAILVWLAIGAVFGAILQRVQISNPDLIQGTLALRDLTVLKFLLLAIGVAAVGVGALTALDLAHLRFRGLPLLSVVGGGLIFGGGFALAGYCPGTCIVGAAEGRKDAVFFLFGGLLGAFVYAFVYPWAARALIAPIDLGRPTLYTVTGLSPGMAGLLFGVALAALALALPLHPGEHAAPQPAPGR